MSLLGEREELVREQRGIEARLVEIRSAPSQIAERPALVRRLAEIYSLLSTHKQPVEPSDLQLTAAEAIARREELAEMRRQEDGLSEELVCWRIALRLLEDFDRWSSTKRMAQTRIQLLTLAQRALRSAGIRA